MSLSRKGSAGSGGGLPREGTEVFCSGSSVSLSHMVRKANSNHPDKASAQACPTLASAPVALAWQPEACSPPWRPGFSLREVAVSDPAPPILSEYWTFRLCFLILAEFKAPSKRAFVWLLAFVLEAEASLEGVGWGTTQTSHRTHRQGGRQNCALAPPVADATHRSL